MTNLKEINLKQRILKYINLFPNIFFKSPDGNLCCLACEKIVNASKDFTIQAHLSTTVHIKKHSEMNNVLDKNTETLKIEQRLDFTNKTRNFANIILDTFISVDIPLYKLRHPKMHSFFNFLGHSLPSESTVRECLNEKFNNEILRIKNLVKDEKIFLVIDETSNGQKYFTCALVGLISSPLKTYCIRLDTYPDSSYIKNFIVEILNEFNIAAKNFLVLLSDAARYMTCAARELKEFYSNLFHFTCIAHLYHNIALRISAHYTKVNTLIATVKAALSKCKKRQALFIDIGLPPDTIVTRWGSWLKTAKWYSENFYEVKLIVSRFQDDGKIVENAKNSFLDETIKNDFLELEQNYFFMINLIENAECVTYSVSKAIEDIKNIKILNDVCNIKAYIEERKTKNDLFNLYQMANESINPSTYAFLLNSQATSISVERSFSMLNKLNTKDRNFKDENFNKHVILHFNLSNNSNNYIY